MINKKIIVTYKSLQKQNIFLLQKLFQKELHIFLIYFKNKLFFDFKIHFFKIPKKKKIYNIMRSPFVYKYSREKFYYEVTTQGFVIFFNSKSSSNSIQFFIKILHYWFSIYRNFIVSFKICVI